MFFFEVLLFKWFFKGFDNIICKTTINNEKQTGSSKTIVKTMNCIKPWQNKLSNNKTNVFEIIEIHEANDIKRV
jgi:hypothetical protein